MGNSNLFHNEARIARALESLLRFRLCHLGPSIDGHGAVYEYVRWPSRWAIVDRNLRTVATQAREHLNLTVVITTVVQAYNVLNLVDLLCYADELGLECNPHVLDGPARLRPHVLPRDLRWEGASQLRAYAGRPIQTPSEIANRAHAERIARYLERMEDEPGLDALQRDFAAFTRELDASRGQSLEAAEPRLARLLQAV